MLKNKTKITLNSLSEDQDNNYFFIIWCSRISNENKCATMAWHTLLSALEKRFKMNDLKEKIISEIKKFMIQKYQLIYMN